MWMLVGVILLAALFRGTIKQNKTYIILIAIMLFTICALRGVRIGADLGRYETHYRTCFQASWSGVFAYYQWDNILFYYLMKLHSTVVGYNFHNFLFILAVAEGIVVAYIIYKHSVNPYMSYLMYMALGYYVFIYSGLKQALATAVLMLAFDAIIDKKTVKFTLLTILAAFIHIPALIFLPAYFLGHRRLSRKMIGLYAVFAVILMVFRGQILEAMTDVYDSVVTSTAIGGVGGKVLMMLVFIIGGYLLRIPDGENKTYSATFNLMIIATILQTFAVYGNVFERLADYYFIFSIIYIPMVFEKMNLREGSEKGIIIYDINIYGILNFIIMIFSVVYFYITVHETYGLLPFMFN